jgi:hypothetical protein
VLPQHGTTLASNPSRSRRGTSSRSTSRKSTRSPDVHASPRTDTLLDPCRERPEPATAIRLAHDEAPPGLDEAGRAIEERILDLAGEVVQDVDEQDGVERPTRGFADVARLERRAETFGRP